MRTASLHVVPKSLRCLGQCSILFTIFALLSTSEATRDALMDENGEFLPHIRLSKDLMDKRRYDLRVRPVVDHSIPTTIRYSMSLYQILEINEKQQNVDLNVWVIQKWTDDFLGWNPHLYGMINTTILPYSSLWLPDTYLYNSVVMNREETERYINVVVTSNYWKGERGSEIMFMYPALYRTSCQLDIRFFPYDQQNCTLVISSWTSSKSDIDYTAEFDTVNLDNFIPNEEWVVVSFEIVRVEEKFVCCPEPWVLLHANLVVRRKPLYYIVNLVIPTSVITMVAVTGFFTAASTSSERREKLSLGIDSLLAMSILMMMVSEQMPTTSDYVPLFGLFYLTIIFVIFIGTLFTAFILNIHLQKMYCRPISPIISFLFFHKIARWLSIRPPTSLVELWEETGVRIEGTQPNKVKARDNFKLGANNNVGGTNENLLKGSSFKQQNAALPTARSADENTVRSVQARNNWKRLARTASARRSFLLNNAAPSLPPDSGRSEESLVAVLAMQQMQDSLLVESKLKRRYALEWEYLASVLDRLLLLLFSLVVFIVTFLMILVGEAMHLSYELNLK